MTNQSNSSRVIDLKKAYPMAIRWPIMRTMSYFYLVLIVVFLIWGLDKIIIHAISDESVLLIWERVMVFFILASISYWLFQLILHWLRKRSYDYKIIGNHFHISKGILLKKRASFPLSQITDIYVERTFRGALFGLYMLNISTPTADSGEFSFIYGLTEERALGLQEVFQKLILSEDVNLHKTLDKVTKLHDDIDFQI